MSIIGDRTGVRAHYGNLVENIPYLESRSSLGCVIRHYALTDSTNIRAREWASEGAVHGSVVLADFQESGRGRFARKWESDAGQNLLLTVVIRQNLPRPALLSLAAAMAVYDVVQKADSTLNVALKWPNDVLIDGKKCSGIMAETASENCFLLGIGLNLNQTDFPDSLTSKATSLLLETGQRQNTRETYLNLMVALEKRILSITESEFIESYTSHLDGMGRQVRVNGEELGVLVGVSEDGGLILESDSGRDVYFAGDITLSSS